MTQISELITTIKADSSQFSTAITKAKEDASSFTSALQAGSVVAIAAFTAIAGAASLVTDEVFKSATRIAELSKNADKIGVTVAALQELSIAAAESGVSADSLQNLLGIMNKKLGEAELGTGTAVKGLKALGISLSDLSQLNADQKFELIASKLALLKDNIPLETALATTIFAKGAKNGIALFNSDIDASIQKVRELGITLSDSQSEGLKKLDDTRNLIGKVWEGFKDNVSADVAPAFTELLQKILDGVKAMGGLKDAAQTTANFITSAMHKMELAITQASTAMQFFKNIGVSSIASGIGGVLDKFLTFMTAPVRNLIIATTNRPDVGTSRAKGITQDDADKLNDLVKTNQTTAAAQALTLFNDSTKKTTDAIKVLEKQALKAAEVMDKFHAVNDALNAPGKKQGEDIIKQATSSENTGTLLADSTKFQEVYNRLIKDVQNNNTKDGSGNSEVPSMINELQSIIDREKEGHLTDGDPVKGADVSGLVQSLNELKSFLAGKGQTKDTQVEVHIKVDASQDFITNVTTTQTFKQAVSKEFDDRIAAAARGDAP